LSRRPEPARVVLFGLGRVGLAFLELLIQRRPPIGLAGVADSKGQLAGNLDPGTVLSIKRGGHLPAQVSRNDLLSLARPDVVVDSMASDFTSAQPSLSVILDAFGAGAHVVTASKAPLARYWARIHSAAESAGRRLGYASSAGAALPAVAVAGSLARADRITSFEGVLSGTTTFVLDEMARGSTLEEAVAKAQREGVAEPDPSTDVEGWDTAAKVVILANTLWGTSFDLNDARVTGLLPQGCRSTRGNKVRLVGSGARRGDNVSLEVAPKTLPQDHPLASLKGLEKGIVFFGDSIGRVVISGGRSSPDGAAATLLGDTLEMMDVPYPRGIASERLWR
jgi:homoserine dehydrogenase